MASRPVFIPDHSSKELVEERNFEFEWASGFAEVQKKKNICALHEAARREGIKNILEISSKSSEKIGKRLSAFSLRLTIDEKKLPLESVYQGSKVFEGGGPFPEIFDFSPREAKRYIRGKNLGQLKNFSFQDKIYPLSPKNAFYDWLYIKSLAEHAEWIKKNVTYEAYTDIEFNPLKQVNCQARAFAEYMSLMKKSELYKSVSNFEHFASMLRPV